MQNTQLLKYIQTIIEDEDAMDILFYSVKKTMADNNFSLGGIRRIEISEIYQEEPVTININRDFPDRPSSFALLLSLKALILYPNLLKYCDDDKLFFLSYGDREFGWSIYSTTILNCYKDNEFQYTYDIFESVVFDGELKEDEIAILNSFIVEPEKKYLLRYYQSLASKKRPNNNVIANNAYVRDNYIENYHIDAEVGYIGNTAFSYCDNLKTIEIEGDHVLFGLFPIVECNALEGIIVPPGAEDYYKGCLPYYKDIIVTSKEDIIHKELPSDKLEEVKSEEIKESALVRDDIKAEQKIDTTKIYEVFKSKATTYKYFWLLAIVSLIKEKGLLSFSYKEIIVRMVAEAWPLIKSYNLDFGKPDQLANIIENIKAKAPISDTDAKSIEIKLLAFYDRYDLGPCMIQLIKNVPFRFLSPWIKYTNDEEVRMKSQSSEYSTPYAICKNGIIIDEDWFDFFVEHSEKLIDFIKIKLGDYLREHNSVFKMIKYKLHSFKR